jgi:hypothetical protein
MRDTIELAREAGDDWDSTLSTDKEFLKRFEALVRADEREEFQRWFDAVTAQHKQEILAEREACAKVCDTTPPYPFRPSIEAAHAIRARSQA